MILTYGELEDFLAEIHRVAPEKRIALKGRLKHFQRLGWPAGTNKGKGARVQYGVGQALSLAMGFELLQLGLTPERVVTQFKYSGRMLPAGFLQALNEYGPYEDRTYYIFAPESLAGLRGEDFSEHGVSSVMISESKLPEIMKAGPMFLSRRFAFIDMSALLTDYINYFIDKGLGDPQRLREPLQAWEGMVKNRYDQWVNNVLTESHDGNP